MEGHCHTLKVRDVLNALLQLRYVMTDFAVSEMSLYI